MLTHGQVKKVSCVIERGVILELLLSRDYCSRPFDFLVCCQYYDRVYTSVYKSELPVINRMHLISWLSRIQSHLYMAFVQIQ